MQFGFSDSYLMIATELHQSGRYCETPSFFSFYGIRRLMSRIWVIKDVHLGSLQKSGKLWQHQDSIDGWIRQASSSREEVNASKLISRKHSKRRLTPLFILGASDFVLYHCEWWHSILSNDRMILGRVHHRQMKKETAYVLLANQNSCSPMEGLTSSVIARLGTVDLWPRLFLFTKQLQEA